MKPTGTGTFWAVENKRVLPKRTSIEAVSLTNNMHREKKIGIRVGKVTQLLVIFCPCSK